MKDNKISLRNVKVIRVDKYRSSSRINQGYDKARVILDLTFPKDLPLYHEFKSMLKKDSEDINSNHVICSGVKNHWACEECSHSKPHEKEKWMTYCSCGKWEICNYVEKNVRCTKVKI